MLKLDFEGFEAARGQLLHFGAAVEVLESCQLRLSLLDFTRQIAALYEASTFPA